MLRISPLLAALLLLPLAGCGPLNTAAFTMSEEVEPPPSDPDASVRNWLWEQQRPVDAGLQLSRPAMMPGTSAFRASRWYVCLREPAPAFDPGLEPASAPARGQRSRPIPRAPETVMILRNDRVIETIAGPSPFFCDDQPYAPLRRG